MSFNILITGNKSPTLSPSAFQSTASSIAPAVTLGSGSTSNLFGGPMYTKLSANRANPTGSINVELGYGAGAIGQFTGFGMNGTYFAAAIFDSRGQGWPLRTCQNADGWKMENVPLPPQMAAYIAHAGSIDSERHTFILGTDRCWSVYDTTTIDSTIWHCSSMGEFRAPGTTHGWWNNPLGPFVGRVSGASDGVGVITKAEMTAGSINHALVAITGSINNANSYREPASASDGSAGSYNSAINLQMGSLLQLDPSISDATFASMGFSSYWLPVLHALQDYGAYTVDSSTNGIFSVIAQSWDNSGQVTLDSDTSFRNNATKLLAHMRLIANSSVPCRAVNGFKLDDRTVFGSPHNP